MRGAWEAGDSTQLATAQLAFALRGGARARRRPTPNGRARIYIVHLSGNTDKHAHDELVL